MISIFRNNPGNTLGWNIDHEDISLWKGVTVNSKGNVVKLEFFNKQLSVIPKEIEVFSSLYFLNLQGNKLKNIPKEIGKLSSLNYLSFFS